MSAWRCSIFMHSSSSYSFDTPVMEVSSLFEVTSQLEPTEVVTNDITTSNKEESDNILYAVSIWLYVAVEPVILSFGLVGNLLIFLTVHLGKRRRTSLSIFMSMLAVADSAVLLLDFLMNWLQAAVKINLLQNYGFCLFHHFIFNVSYTYATWLVVAVAVERFIVVWFPLKVRAVCTVRGSVITVVAMFVALCVLYVYNLWGWYVDNQGNCDTTAGMFYFNYIIAPWLTGALYAYLPLAIILLCSLAITCQLQRANVQRQEMSGAETVDTHRKTTLMILSVCVSFFLLTVPVTAWYIIMFAEGLFLSLPPHLALGRAIIILFGLMNHAINFFLYGLTSSNFRQDVYWMLTKKVQSEESAFTQSLALSDISKARSPHSKLDTT